MAALILLVFIVGAIWFLALENRDMSGQRLCSKCSHAFHLGACPQAACDCYMTCIGETPVKCANCHFEIKPGTRHGKIEPLSCIVTMQTIFRESSSPTEFGAESVHSGKQHTVDKSGAAPPELLPTQLPKEKE